MHSEEVVNEPEHFQEESKAVLAEHGHVHGHVEEGLSQLVVGHLEATRPSKDVSCQLVVIWEQKLCGTVAERGLETVVSLHLQRVEGLEPLHLDLLSNLAETLAEDLVFPDQLAGNVAPIEVLVRHVEVAVVIDVV